MPGLGNRSFQGFGLHADLARRLEDLARQISANQSDVATLKSSAIDAPTAATIAHSVAQKIATSTVLNITNATGTSATATGSGTAYATTHASRPAASSYPNGTLYWETDRTVLYMALTGRWVYVAGMMSATQATLPVDLGSGDAGFLVNVTDYAHQLQWNGAAWGWAPGDSGSGYIGLFEVDPGTGWHLYDGSAVNYLLGTGALASVTLPDLTSIAANAAYPKAGSPNSGPNAAVAPTPTGSPSATQAVATGSGTSVASGAHTHTVPATGEPRNLQRRPFFRQ